MPSITINLTDKILEKIEQYRIQQFRNDHKIMNRNKAIRELLKFALNHKLKEK